MAKKKVVKKASKLKVFEGALVGAVVGVAAGMFLSTPEGKEVKKKAKKTAEIRLAEFLKVMAPKIKKIEKMTEKEYKEFMEKAALKYCEKRELPKKERESVVAKAVGSWKHIKKHF